MRISAVTLSTTSMAKAVHFYKQLGFEMHRGGETATFSTFQVGEQHLNLRLGYSRHNELDGMLVIFATDDVDRTYRRFIDSGLLPEFAPRDAEWGERYFHIRDPDGNALSFSKRFDVEGA